MYISPHLVNNSNCLSSEDLRRLELAPIPGLSHAPVPRVFCLITDPLSLSSQPGLSFSAVSSLLLLAPAAISELTPSTSHSCVTPRLTGPSTQLSRTLR